MAVFTCSPLFQPHSNQVLSITPLKPPLSLLRILRLPFLLTDSRWGGPRSLPQALAPCASAWAPVAGAVAVSLSRAENGTENNLSRTCPAQGLSSRRRAQPQQRSKGRIKTRSFRALGCFSSPLHFSSKRTPCRRCMTTFKLSALRTF